MNKFETARKLRLAPVSFIAGISLTSIHWWFFMAAASGIALFRSVADDRSMDVEVIGSR